MVAVDVEAADEVRDEGHRPGVVVQQAVERPAGPLIAFARLDDLIDQARQDLIDQLHAPACELDRVLAQVEAIHQRIGIEQAGVFVGGVLQGRLGAARGDLRQFGHFALGAAAEAACKHIRWPNNRRGRPRC